MHRGPGSHSGRGSVDSELASGHAARPCLVRPTGTGQCEKDPLNFCEEEAGRRGGGPGGGEEEGGRIQSPAGNGRQAQAGLPTACHPVTLRASATWGCSAERMATEWRRRPRFCGTGAGEVYAE